MATFFVLFVIVIVTIATLLKTNSVVSGTPLTIRELINYFGEKAQDTHYRRCDSA